MTTPLVSILIPTYNRRELVASALASALSQTYSHTEILVHDNHSSDGTPLYLKQYTSDPRVRLFLAPHNRGMIGAWNYLLKMARGKYLKFLASDDLLDPTCVAKLTKVLESHQGAVLATCQRRFVYDEQGRVETRGMATESQIFVGGKLAHSLLTCLRVNPIGEPTAVLFRRNVALRVGGFDPRYSQLADFEYWLRLLEYGDVAYHHEALCTFSLHAKSSTSAAIADGRFIDETYALISKYYGDPHYRQIFALRPKDRQQVTRLRTLDFAKNIKDLMLTGRLSQALRYILRLTSLLRR